MSGEGEIGTKRGNILFTRSHGQVRGWGESYLLVPPPTPPQQSNKVMHLEGSRCHLLKAELWKTAAKGTLGAKWGLGSSTYHLQALSDPYVPNMSGPTVLLFPGHSFVRNFLTPRSRGQSDAQLRIHTGLSLWF